MTDGQDDDESVLARVEPYGADPDDVAAYDVVVDLLNQVVGVYSAQIRDEQRREPVDHEAVAALRETQASYVGTQRRLRPGDRERVAELRRECAAIIREFEAGLS